MYINDRGEQMVEVEPGYLESLRGNGTGLHEAGQDAEEKESYLGLDEDRGQM